MTWIQRALAAESKVRELKLELEVYKDVIDRQAIYIKELRRKAGLAPHDFEPARPGIDDVD